MRRLKKIVLLSLLIALFTTISGYIYYYLLLPQIVGWDEANHLYWGWRVYESFRDFGGIGEIWEIIRTQFNYPPLQSIITGVFSFLTGGFSIEKARSLSIIWFWGSVVLIWKIGGLVAERREDTRIRERFLSDVRNDKGNRLPRSLKLVRIIPVLLFVTSPLVLYYSSLHMKEGLGTFLTLLTVYFYFRGIGVIRGIGEIKESGRRMYLLLAGISLLLTTFEKYNYGLLLVFVFSAEFILEAVTKLFKSKEGTKKFSISNFKFLITCNCGYSVNNFKFLISNYFLILGLTLIGLFFWVVWPKNQLEFFFYTLRSDWNIYSLYDTSMLVHVLFFPLEIITSYSFSYLLGVLGLLGFLGSLFYIKDFRVRVLFSLFVINLILGTLHYYNDQARYIFTSVPALFLLTGYVTEKFLISNFQFPINFKFQISKLLKQKPILLGFLGGLGVLGGVILLIELVRLPFMVRPTAAHVNLAAVYGERDYRDNQFNFNKFSWQRAYQGNIYEKQIEVVRYIVERVDLTKPVYIFGRTNEFSPPFFDLMFGMEKKQLGRLGRLGILGKGFNEYFVTLEVMPGGILDTGDYKKMNKDFSSSEIARFRAAVNTQMLSSRTFNEFGLTVGVWGR